MLSTAGLLALLLALQVPPPAAGPGLAAAPLRAEREAILADEAQALAVLGDKLEESGKKGEAKQVRERIDLAGSGDGPTRFVPLPEVVPARDPKADSLPAEAKAARSAAAKKLLDLARRAAAPPNRRYSLADACLRDVLDREPDHAEARRLLGYLPHDGGWATPHAVQMLKQGFVRDATFGWVRADWVPHLEKGELPGRVDGAGRALQWLPAAEADALRRDWSRAWTVDTAPHFRIRTNVPLAEGIAFAQKLELLHDVFFAVMADVLAAGGALPLAQRFDRPTAQPTAPKEKFEVWYFAAQGEYADYLKQKFGKDERESLGYYMPPQEARGYRATPRSYFWKDEGGQIKSDATLFHEASHQLLFESGRSSGYLRNVGNFWVWEGLGTYFETLEVQADGSVRIGGLIGPRVGKAVELIVEQGEYVPTAELVALNQDRYLEKPGVYLNYNESTALVAYLMHADDADLRAEFLDYVADAYQGKARSRQALAEHLGIGYDALDERFRAYLTRKAR